MTSCTSCGTVAPAGEQGRCVACGAQIAPPTPPPYVAPASELPPPPIGVPPAGVTAHCSQCGGTLGGTDRFCATCGNPRSHATAGEPATPATGPQSPRPRSRSLIVAGVAIIALVAIIGAVVALQAVSGDEGDTETAAAAPTTTTTSLADRTSELGDQIGQIICPGSYCVDSSTAGVILIDTKPGGEYSTDYIDGTDLEQIAQELHAWSVADARRMGTTRALDGTQSSVNGAVTWTYHPDQGLNIVVDVESLPQSG